MMEAKRILLVDDDPKDVELMLTSVGVVKQLGLFWVLTNETPQNGRQSNQE